MTAPDHKYNVYLPTAGLFIGWASVVVCFIQGFYIILIMADVPRVTEQMIVDPKAKKDGTADAVKSAALLVLSCYLSFVIVDLVASIFLIIGTDTDSYLMLLPWLISNAFSIIVRFTCCFCLCIFCFLSDEMPFGNTVFILIHFVLTGVYCWMWMIIHALYLHLKELDE